MSLPGKNDLNLTEPLTLTSDYLYQFREGSYQTTGLQGSFQKAPSSDTENADRASPNIDCAPSDDQSVHDSTHSLGGSSNSSDTGSTEQGGDDGVEQWLEESQETFDASFYPSASVPQEPMRVDPLTDSIQVDDCSTSDRDNFPENFDEDVPVAPEEVAHAIAFRDKILTEWNRGERDPSVPLSFSEASILPGSEYLDATVGPLLAQGLAEILQRRPNNPVEFLAAYLLADQVRIDTKLESPTLKPATNVSGVETEFNTDLPEKVKPGDNRGEVATDSPADSLPDKARLAALTPVPSSTNLKAAKSATSTGAM